MWVLAFVCGTMEEMKQLLKLYASQKSLSYRKYSAEKYQHWQFAYYMKNATVWGANKCTCKTRTLYIPHLPKLIQDWIWYDTLKYKKCDSCQWLVIKLQWRPLNMSQVKVSCLRCELGEGQKLSHAINICVALLIHPRTREFHTRSLKLIFHPFNTSSLSKS
jgi:hypothetical protein